MTYTGIYCNYIFSIVLLSKSTAASIMKHELVSWETEVYWPYYSQPGSSFKSCGHTVIPPDQSSNFSEEYIYNEDGSLNLRHSWTQGDEESCNGALHPARRLSESMYNLQLQTANG